MTNTWKKHFKDYFAALPDKWNLQVYQEISSLADIKVVARYGWKKFQDKAKVRFQCSECERSWTSVKGTVIFHYRLDRTQNKGQVEMWLLGQKCSKCGDKFEDAKWYDGEIKKCLKNLLTKVQEKFYDDSNTVINTSQRAANMSSEHRSELCQACAQGVCGQRVNAGNKEEVIIDGDEDDWSNDDYYGDDYDDDDYDNYDNYDDDNQEDYGRRYEEDDYDEYSY